MTNLRLLGLLEGESAAEEVGMVDGADASDVDSAGAVAALVAVGSAAGGEIAAALQWERGGGGWGVGLMPKASSWAQAEASMMAFP